MKLSTEEFWKAMCDPKFHRIDIHTGMIQDQILETDEAPEELPTFIEAQMDRIRELLVSREREMSLAMKYCRRAEICFFIYIATWLVILLLRVL